MADFDMMNNNNKYTFKLQLDCLQLTGNEKWKCY